MLFYFLSGLGVALTAVLYLLTPGLSLWWAIPIALGLIVLCNALYVLAVYLYCKRIDMDREYDTIDPGAHRWMMTFLRWLLAVCRVKIRTVNMDIVPREGEFLLVGNHRSGFDPLTTIVAMADWPLAFISKPENIYKLFVGPAPYKCCFLPIDRENARNALKTINTAAARMKAHACSYGIYPEGTRTRDGKLGEFKPGAFKTAQKAHVPVVVVAAQGSEQVLKRLPFRSTVVTLTYLAVIDADTVKAKKTHELADEVKEMLLQHLGE